MMRLGRVLLALLARPATLGRIRSDAGGPPCGDDARVGL